MSHLVNHPARFRRVLQLHRVADAPQPEAADDGELLTVEPHRADLQRHLDDSAFRAIGSLICHKPYAVARVRSPISLPRSRASSAGSLSESSPAIVARTTLCGFADPSDFVMML